MGDGRRPAVRRAAGDARLPRRRARGRPAHERAHELADERELRQRRQLAEQPRQLGTPRLDLQDLERGPAQLPGVGRGAGAHAPVAQQPPAAGHPRAHPGDGLALRPRRGPVFHQPEAHLVAERPRLRLARLLLILLNTFQSPFYSSFTVLQVASPTYKQLTSSLNQSPIFLYTKHSQVPFFLSVSESSFKARTRTRFERLFIIFSHFFATLFSKFVHSQTAADLKAPN